MDPRIVTLIELMRTNHRTRLTLREMAQIVSLSPAHLCFLFKTETGTPPARYLRKMRMRNAATLLEETSLSVKEVMARVGFSDESHFVRDFKRIYQMTPGEYRRRARAAGLEGFDKNQGLLPLSKNLRTKI